MLKMNLVVKEGPADVGLLKAIIDYASNQYISSVAADLTFGMGWSNGGCLVSDVAYLF